MRTLFGKEKKSRGASRAVDSGWMGGIHLVEKTATLDQRESRRGEERSNGSKISESHLEKKAGIDGKGDEVVRSQVHRSLPLAMPDTMFATACSGNPSRLTAIALYLYSYTELVTIS